MLPGKVADNRTTDAKTIEIERDAGAKNVDSIGVGGNDKIARQFVAARLDDIEWVPTSSGDAGLVDENGAVDCERWNASQHRHESN
jgi:hypothetical protein